MITINSNDFNSLWLFSVRNADTDELLYVGCERLKTIGTLRELKRHSLGKLPSHLDISLLEPVQDDSTLNSIRAEMQPRYCATPQPRNYRQVRCNETGEVFDNCQRAATAYNISYAYLHYHLKSPTTYKSCKGLTFSYIEG